MRHPKRSRITRKPLNSQKRYTPQDEDATQQM